MKTIRKNDSGPAVEDVQKRLRVLNYALQVDGKFQERTEAAVRDFRQKEGLPSGNFIDEVAWKALVDATFNLGDRMLYLRMPYFHGSDVRQLQEILEVLGFVSGGADGIFGAHTEHALREFQASVGLDDDGVAGTSTYDSIMRLRHAWEGKSATSEDTQDHMGFARAADALEDMEACFFGMDDLCRSIAHRAANLAQATAPFSRVASADTLSVRPSSSMVMIGIAQGDASEIEGLPAINMGTVSFKQRLATALSVIRNDGNRLVVCVGKPEGVQDSDDAAKHWEQHVAVTILDALCGAWK